MARGKRAEVDGATMCDVLTRTAAVITAGGYVLRWNRRTEHFEIWLKDTLLFETTDESDAAQKFINIVGEPDFAQV